MTLDFSLIEDQWVGYVIDDWDTEEGGNFLRQTFGNFIRPYLQNTKTYQEAYEKLKVDLQKELEEQNQLAGTRVDLTDIMDSYEKREAIMNSIRLLHENYDIPFLQIPKET